MAYRIQQTIGKPFATPTVLDLTLPDGTKTQLTVQYRHMDVDSKPRPLYDKDIYADTVMSISGIVDDSDNPVDPIAAVEACKADNWLVSALALGYRQAVGETWRAVLGA